MACRFNLGIQEIKNLPGQRDLKHFSVVTYVNSVVSVRGGNKFDIEYDLTREAMHRL